MWMWVIRVQRKQKSLQVERCDFEDDACPPFVFLTRFITYISYLVYFLLLRLLDQCFVVKMGREDEFLHQHC